jgi:hypothetical protein
MFFFKTLSLFATLIQIIYIPILNHITLFNGLNCFFIILRTPYPSQTECTVILKMRRRSYTPRLWDMSAVSLVNKGSCNCITLILCTFILRNNYFKYLIFIHGVRISEFIGGKERIYNSPISPVPRGLLWSGTGRIY